MCACRMCRGVCFIWYGTRCVAASRMPSAFLSAGGQSIFGFTSVAVTLSNVSASVTPETGAKRGVPGVGFTL